MTRAWDMHRCTIKPANLLPFVDKLIQVKQIYVSGTKETGYVGTNEIINATVKKYEESQKKTTAFMLKVSNVQLQNHCQYDKSTIRKILSNKKKSFFRKHIRIEAVGMYRILRIVANCLFF